MIVSWPFSAPACPPLTGASRNPTPLAAATAASSRARSADAVVWSMSTEPADMPASTPSSPSVTLRTSASLPTQTNTKSAPAAACAGVGAVRPTCSADHASALAAVRL